MDGNTLEDARELLARFQEVITAAEAGGKPGWGPFADIVIMKVEGE
jgi:hypothetical protein